MTTRTSKPYLNKWIQPWINMLSNVSDFSNIQILLACLFMSFSTLHLYSHHEEHSRVQKIHDFGFHLLVLSSIGVTPTFPRVGHFQSPLLDFPSKVFSCLVHTSGVPITLNKPLLAVMTSHIVYTYI